LEYNETKGNAMKTKKHQLKGKTTSKNLIGIAVFYFLTSRWDQNIKFNEL